MAGVQLKLPWLSATAVHSGTPFSPTVTVTPGSAVPMTGGLLLPVKAPGAGAVTTGAAGGTVSTVNGRGVAGLVLPAASVAVALAVCGPSTSGSAGVQFQLPLESVKAVHSVALPSLTVTVDAGSAVPLKGGLLLLVLAKFAGVTITGAAGGTVSTVTGT